MATPAQIRANRENARRSTGPRTEAGKRRSSANNLRHGLAGKGICLLPGDEEIVEHRLRAWSESLQPQDDLQTYFVNLAVVSSVQLDRSLLQGAAMLAQKIARVGDERRAAEEAEADEIDRLFDAQPASAAARLRGTAAGCTRLVGRWRELRDELELGGYWGPEHAERAVLLIGGPSAGGEGGPPAQLAEWVEAARPEPELISAVLPDGRRRPKDDPEMLAFIARHQRRQEARRALADLVEAETAALVAERARLESEPDEDGLHEAIRRSLFDSSHEATLRQRYAVANERTLHRSLDAVEKLQRRGPSPRAPRTGAEDRAALHHDGLWLRVPEGWDGPEVAEFLTELHRADLAAKDEPSARQRSEALARSPEHGTSSPRPADEPDPSRDEPNPPTEVAARDEPNPPKPAISRDEPDGASESLSKTSGESRGPAAGLGALLLAALAFLAGWLATEAEPSPRSVATRAIERNAAQNRTAAPIIEASAGRSDRAEVPHRRC